jgi:hypothetical protein
MPFAAIPEPLGVLEKEPTKLLRKTSTVLKPSSRSFLWDKEPL